MLRNLTRKFRFANNRLTKTKKTVGIDSKNTEVGNRKFVEYLQSRRPFAAGKIGTAEILGLEFHDRIIRLPFPRMSWRRPASRLANNAGFFPVEKEAFKRWNTEMRESVANLDFICLWQRDPFTAEYEQRLVKILAPKAKRIPMSDLGKNMLPLLAPYRLLVISPFVKTMQKQLPYLMNIHGNDKLEKKSWDQLASKIRFLRCPFQWHLEKSPFPSWETGLEILFQEAKKETFEIALIGAGAWSIPLAAKIKNIGRTAIHTGGETQLFFGIKGKRWDNKNIYNQFWRSCLPEETPPKNSKIDNGCYW
jgi:hypothetical protein